MKYCITIERTMRIAKWFEAADDESATKEAHRIVNNVKPEEFEGGDKESDWALCADDGTMIVDWE